MNAKSLLAILPILSLQACNSSQDLLMHSSSRMPMPVGAVHVPSHDSGMVLQGSIAVSKLPETPTSIAMSMHNGFLQSSNGNTSQVLGPSEISTPSVQIAATGSIFVSDHVRFGLAADGTPEKLATWLEVGFSGGRVVSIEGFCAYGTVPVHSNAQWQIQTIDRKYSSFSGSYIGNDTIRTAQTIDSTTRQNFIRFGVHVARRQGGPWAELQLGSLDLLPASPTANDQWGTKMTLVGVGWSEPTPLGTATGYARGMFFDGNLLPVFGLQWSGELKLGN